MQIQYLSSKGSKATPPAPVKPAIPTTPALPAAYSQPRTLPHLKPSQLSKWLEGKGLGHLVEPFLSECIDGQTLIDIKDSLGKYPKLNTSPGDRVQLVKVIEEDGF